MRSGAFLRRSREDVHLPWVLLEDCTAGFRGCRRNSVCDSSALEGVAFDLYVMSMAAHLFMLVQVGMTIIVGCQTWSAAGAQSGKTLKVRV